MTDARILATDLGYKVQIVGASAAYVSINRGHLKTLQDALAVCIDLGYVARDVVHPGATPNHDKCVAINTQCTGFAQ